MEAIGGIIASLLGVAAQSSVIMEFRASGKERFSPFWIYLPWLKRYMYLIVSLEAKGIIVN